MPVGGSRFYQGGGLGQEGIWGCPSCGHDNEGPISQGCAHCGAGRPGHRAEPPPPPPLSAPAPEFTAEDAPEVEPPAASPEKDNDFTRWLTRHPEATLEQAYTAGYIEGVRAARRTQLAEQRTQENGVRYTGDAKITRTLIAALAHFRDQILALEPEEVTTGEWLSAEEATLVMKRLQLEVEEAAHV